MHIINSILLLGFIVVGCAGQSNRVMFEKTDVNGFVFEETLIDTVQKVVVSKMYVFSNNDTLYLPTVDCIAPYPDYTEESFNRLLEDNLNWPSSKEVLGDVLLCVLISSDGQLLDVRILKEISICPECSSFAKEFAYKIQHWKPSICKGRTSLNIAFLKIPFRPYPTDSRM